MENYYRTKDLGEASALMAKGQRLINLERKDGICWFLFEDKQKCEKLSNNFFFGELLVNARDYQDAMTRLKNRIFA